MKKILIIFFVLSTVVGFSQVRRPVLDWGVTVSDFTATDSITAATLKITGVATIGSTLGVTGTTTLAGALNAAGACGFGVSNNKVTIAAATGNTLIAGTLGVSGTITLPGGTTLAKTSANANSATLNHSLAVTDTLAAPTIKDTKIVIMSAAAGSDTTAKTAGKIVYIGGNFWGCDGTYYYKFAK